MYEWECMCECDSRPITIIDDTRSFLEKIIRFVMIFLQISQLPSCFRLYGYLYVKLLRPLLLILLLLLIILLSPPLPRERERES